MLSKIFIGSQNNVSTFRWKYFWNSDSAHLSSWQNSLYSPQKADDFKILHFLQSKSGNKNEAHVE